MSCPGRKQGCSVWVSSRSGTPPRRSLCCLFLMKAPGRKAGLSHHFQPMTLHAVTQSLISLLSRRCEAGSAHVGLFFLAPLADLMK